MQRYLRNQGHEAFIIRMLYGNSFFSKIKKLVKRLLIWLKIIRADYAYRRNCVLNKNDNQRLFGHFRDNFISTSRIEYHHLWMLRLFYPKADCYITGSDQVWGMPLSDPKEAWHYLDFGSRITKRISYAASFGRDTIQDSDKDIFIRYASKLDMISAREINGVNICKNLGFNAIRCVDSTLLLDAKDYESLLAKRKHPSSYAYIYSVNMTSASEIYWSTLKHELSNMGLIPIVTTASGYIAAKEIFDDAEYDYATPHEWLSNIYYSDIVITSSFHGVVFSILFRKNFIYFPLKSKYKSGNDRVIDLLELAGLENRTADSKENAINLLKSKIDYLQIDASRLHKLIDQSKDFLGSLK